jgi:hypothetical protein
MAGAAADFGSGEKKSAARRSVFAAGERRQAGNGASRAAGPMAFCRQ